MQEDGDEPTAAVQTSAAPAASSTPAAQPASKKPTATSEYDYEAAEENELTFPEGAKITDIVSRSKAVLGRPPEDYTDLCHRSFRTMHGGQALMAVRPASFQQIMSH